MTPNFEVVSLKPSGGDLILRGYETLGRAGGVVVRVPFEPRRAWVTNLLEEPVAEARVHGKELACGCAPHEIVTLRVER
jgi:alpha-mannosidase